MQTGELQAGGLLESEGDVRGVDRLARRALHHVVDGREDDHPLVAGSNDAEIGFELDAGNERVVVFSAIDNMMKGSAGQAVHAANVALGFEETAGLEFPGLHPVGAP